MKLKIAVSDISDGNMFDRQDKSNQQVIENRRKFLSRNNIDIDNTSLISTTYHDNDFRRYLEVGQSNIDKGMFGTTKLETDALVVREANHALFLPVADCLAAVIFDPENGILMLSHLGRHHLIQNGGFYSVEYLISQYHCRIEKLLVFLSPSAGSQNYPLFDFQNQSIKEVAIKQFLEAGIKNGNITDNKIDVTDNRQYYSHSEFKKGNRDIDGRFAVVAVMIT